MSVMQALHARAIMVVPSAQWQLPSPLSEEEAQPHNSTAFARRLVLVFSCLDILDSKLHLQWLMQIKL